MVGSIGSRQRIFFKINVDHFLGKFGQQLNLTRTQYLTEPVNYYYKLTSVPDVSFVNDEMVRIAWVNKDDFIENTGRTIVSIAA